MVADLLDLLGWPLTADIATNLWVSLVSDTGSFRYSNTTPKALALGARLVAAGAEPGPVNEFLFEAAPLSSLRLEALVLGTLELHAGGTVATVELPRRFFENGEIRCSLRSKGVVDIRSVAARHAGGGHRNASGCRVPGTLATAKAALVPEIAAAVAAVDAASAVPEAG
jgi:phosphoesterase RecJ-like protein